MKSDQSQFQEEEEFEITPLIDVVFLLLVYFMVTATILREEADLSISLPAQVQVRTETIENEEMIVDIHANGQVVVNGERVDDPTVREMPELQAVFNRTKALADAMGSRATVVIQANEDSRHQRTIDVLNAAAGANIRFVTFGSPAS